MTPLLADGIAALPLAPVALASGAYASRARTLAKAGRTLPHKRMVAAAAAAGVVLIALSPPFDNRADASLSWHMGQHLLLGDLAPLLAALACTRALLRPLLAIRPVHRARWMAHPAIALPLWIAVVGAWHTPYLYDAALANDALHALEHASFVAVGLLVWAPLLEVLPAPRAFTTTRKIAYSLLQRTAMTGFGYALFFVSAPLYAHYATTSQTAALNDQRIAAGLMMLEGAIVGVAVTVALLHRLLAHAAAAQRLSDAGAPAREVARVARYGPRRRAPT
jgi:cytochrome c oxidase assembly factor CtaG